MNSGIVLDQAQSLRDMVSRNRSRHKIITVTSGKGGVGKSSITVNLAIALARIGYSVLVVDADFGLANIDVMLGINAKYNLSHLLRGQRTLGELVQQGYQGVKFISGGSGVYELLCMDEAQLNGVMNGLLDMREGIDIILFDTGAGINDNVLKLIMASTETIVVTTPEPTAILDAYALVKTVNKSEGAPPIRLVMNKCETKREAENAIVGFQSIIRKYMRWEIESLGAVYFDTEVSKSIKRQTPIIVSHPNGQTARGITDIARALMQLPTQEAASNPITRLFSRFLK